MPVKVKERDDIKKPIGRNA